MPRPRKRGPYWLEWEDPVFYEVWERSGGVRAERQQAVRDSQCDYRAVFWRKDGTRLMFAMVSKETLDASDIDPVALLAFNLNGEYDWMAESQETRVTFVPETTRDFDEELPSRHHPEKLRRFEYSVTYGKWDVWKVPT